MEAVHNIVVLTAYVGLTYLVWFGFEWLTNLNDIEREKDGEDIDTTSTN